MAGSTRSVIVRALCLGLGGGLRSLSPFAALALSYDDATVKRGWRQWAMFREKRERRMMVALASVEYVSDKVPWAQPRIALSMQPSTGDTGLVGRVGLVTVAGAALGSEGDWQEDVLTGAAFAAVGAVLANYAGYYAREALNKATDVPDVVLALVEDAVAIGLLAAAVKATALKRL